MTTPEVTAAAERLLKAIDEETGSEDEISYGDIRKLCRYVLTPSAGAAGEEPVTDGYGIYAASKTEHARLWRGLRADGWPIISSWIDEAEPGESACLVDLWLRCIREASSCERLILYTGNPDGILKGALVEVGAALANGRKVIIVGESHQCVGSFKHHPLVETVGSLASALSGIQRKETP